MHAHTSDIDLLSGFTVVWEGRNVTNYTGPNMPGALNIPNSIDASVLHLNEWNHVAVVMRPDSVPDFFVNGTLLVCFCTSVCDFVST